MFTITQLDMIAKAAEYAANYYKEPLFTRSLEAKYVDFAYRMRQAEGGQDFNHMDAELAMNCTGRYMSKLGEDAPEYHEYSRIHDLAMRGMVNGRNRL